MSNPFNYNYDVDEFFENDYDPELDRSRLINKYADENYQVLTRNGVHPLDAMNLATDAAVIQASSEIDLDYEPTTEEFAPMKQFWDALRKAIQ